MLVAFVVAILIIPFENGYVYCRKYRLFPSAEQPPAIAYRVPQPTQTPSTAFPPHLPLRFFHTAKLAFSSFKCSRSFSLQLAFSPMS